MKVEKHFPKACPRPDRAISERKEGPWVNYYLAVESSSPYAALLLASLHHWLIDDPEISDLMTTLRFIHRDNISKK